MDRIASFSVDHDYIVPGIYISRIDGDVTTYDLRTRKPNTGDLMDNATMHSLEHMFATIIRNSKLGGSVVYFGPMGCQTGFYLLIRNAEHAAVIEAIKSTLRDTVAYTGEMPGNSRRECGNYINLSLEKAKAESARYLAALEGWNTEKLAYPKGDA